MLTFKPGGAQVLIPGMEVWQPVVGVSALYQSLVAFWKLDEASGNRADSIGSNTLTDNNTVLSATGLVYALAGDFERDNSERLSIADNAALSVADIDFWLAAWVKMESKNVADTSAILAKYAGTGNQRAYMLSYEGQGSIDRFQFLASSAGTSGSVTSVSANNLGSPSTGAWYFLLVWHDSVADTINIQANNGTVNSAAHSAGVLDSTAQFNIGSGESGASRFFDGLIGPAMMGKGYIPSAADRTWLYNGGAGRTLAEMAAY